MGKIKEGQLSLDYESPRSDFLLKFNSSMFIQDLSISKYSIKDEYLSISLESKKEEEISEFLANKVTTFQYRNQYWMNSSNLEDEILQLIETISNQLTNKGHCVFEKVYDEGKLSRLKIVTGEVEVKMNNVVQIIPDEIALKNESKSRISIPKEKCFIIDFPKSICSRKEYLNILKKMHEIDSKNPIHSILNPTSLNKANGYDMMKHRDKLDIILKRSTKNISWHHREQFSSKEKFSSYYSTLRSLKFRRTKIILLNHIFDFIKLIIENVFDETSLKISYSKTLDEIDNIILDYEKGKFTREQNLKIIKEFM
ncbi:MAG: hypothetical protein AB8B52_09330 [Winogradskyella sp.]|uniref:hypothetical protein n=1 Tax=Winogradskyella sp. TaxID=1883156 RepID=UPI00385BDA93